MASEKPTQERHTGSEPSGGFTPGPWNHSEGATARDPRVWIYAPVGANKPRIATVEYVFGVDTEAVVMNMANARLIAASPDLLAALQAIASGTFEGDLALAVSGRWGAVVGELQGIARAAIAKALGGPA